MAYTPFPTGTVLSFAGSVAPDGWLLCDGSAVSRATYARLFAIVGTTYGAGDGSTTFIIPDLRGVYPRGAGTNGTANYGGVTGHTPAGGTLANKGGQKTAKNGLVQSGGTASLTGTTTFSSNGHNHYEGDLKAAIGATGGDAGSIGYSASSPQARGPSTVDSYTVFGTSNTSSTRTYNHHTPVYGTTGGNNQSASVGISSTAASLSAGDTETTPAFLALNYIIKL